MKIIKTLVIVLAVVIVLSAVSWYLTSYNPEAVTNTLVWWADRAENQGWHTRAIRLYTMARNIDYEDPDIALSLADAYQQSGNYTKTEYTLVDAITDMPDETELYVALCRVYVEQDKLLDAVQMLSAIASTTVRDEIDAMRPAAPALSPESGYYNEYISVSLSCEGGTAYMSTTDEYPSVQDAPYTEPTQLDDGKTTVTAIVVGDNGLVSEASAAVYTVGSVVQDVAFTDPVLEETVRSILGKDEDDAIRSDEVWTIEALEIPEGVATLKDISLFEGLQSLTAENLTGVDLTPIAELPALTGLYLTGCNVSDEELAAIGGITTLCDLQLTDCSISSLAALTELTSLSILNVSENSIGSLEPLSGLTGLTTLDVSDNAVQDLTALSGLTGLTTLYVSGNPLDALSGLPEGLTMLDSSNCGLDDEGFAAGSAGFSNLDTLLATDNALTDISLLKDCASLRILDVSGNDLTSIDVAADLPLLEELSVGNNGVAALPDFSDDSVLTTLEAPYNALTSLTGLENLLRLNYVDVDYNDISDLTPLQNCLALVQISAYGNPISVAEATALTDSGVIVHYSPDYTEAETDADTTASTDEAATDDADATDDTEIVDAAETTETTDTVRAANAVDSTEAQTGDGSDTADYVEEAA